ncbi:MAG: hypothetical protein KAV00_17305 [Phycisphaerae bacterium]|nr:hypothetical protein [Phycisphaerae bacterium]
MLSFEIFDIADAPPDSECSPDQTQFLTQFEKPLREGRAVNVQLAPSEGSWIEFDQMVEWIRFAACFFAKRGLLIRTRMYGLGSWWLIPLASDPVPEAPRHKANGLPPAARHASPPKPVRPATRRPGAPGHSGPPIAETIDPLDEIRQFNRDFYNCPGDAEVLTPLDVVRRRIDSNYYDHPGVLDVVVGQLCQALGACDV